MHRVDRNQNRIVEALEVIGASVERLGSKDQPDLLVGYQHRNYLMEVKTESGKLRDGQEDFQERWKGQVSTVRTIADALRVLGVHVRAAPDEPEQKGASHGR